MHRHRAHAHVPARTVVAGLAVTLVAAGAETVGAWSGGSMFLAADAVHLFAHVGIFGVLLMPAARWHDVGEDAATIAVLAIVATIAAGIVLVSVNELIASADEPPDPAFFLLSVLGLAANLISAYLFKRPAETHWSFRAALAHQLSDAAHRVIGLLGALAIELFAWRWVDPGLSLLIGLWLGLWAGRLLARRFRFGPGIWALEDEH